MQKEKRYDGTNFSPRLLRAAVDQVAEILTGKKHHMTVGRVTVGDERWSFDDIEEFFACCGNANASDTNLSVEWNEARAAVTVVAYDGQTSVTVKSQSRALIDAVFSLFDEATSPDRIGIPRDERASRVTVFIGHGQGKQWEKLRSHLQDKHQMSVLSYEIGARAGHTVRDILDGMPRKTSLAFLVVTGEDEDRTKDGPQVRQHVVHECGLFQGRLGFDRAILIVEQGSQLTSSFDGIQQFPFKKGRISETFDDVIATIDREFGPVGQPAPE